MPGSASSVSPGSSSDSDIPESGSHSSGSSVISGSGSLLPDDSASSTLPQDSSLSVMSTDFTEIGTLPSEELNWGPGGPKDEKNRSQGALVYNDRYGKYNARFLADDEPVVYMTFDEGYENGYTAQILDVLKQKDVKALFFITGDYAKRQPELVRRMIDEGHIVGSHSWSHANYGTLTPEEAADDLITMHNYVLDNYGYAMKYFRFPSGNFNEQTLALAQSLGYQSVFWSFAYVDWYVDQQPDPAESADKIVNAACNGNIYLLHAVSSTNADILGEVIDRIAQQGFTWGDPGAL